ncbi:MAG: T9SS type A sorting domain-containing protein [Saprospiraceae bacterium]|nr:T9SS type A sorting domain-containing protein [Saprospiraceae bacterium]
MNKQYIFYIWFLTLLSFAGEAQQTVSGTLTHDNVVRNYRLRLPKDHQKTEAIPLVFNFHGFSSNAGQQEFYSGMNTLADKEKFAVCYPNGINAAWNVGWSFGSTADDVGFTEAMIEKFVIDYGFDRSRIYACGMSNGGFFSYNDQSTVEKYVYKDCDTDREVWLYKVLGGGHTWPGAIISIGVTNQDINANEEIWKFFKRFSLPKTNSISEQNESTAIFPNPAFDKINLAYKDVHNVQIFNAFGRLVLEDFYLSPGQTLDILNLPKGMYILTCQADGKPVVHKFIKM